MKIVIDARELRTSTGRYVERLLHYLQKLDNQNNYVVLLKPQDFEDWIPNNPKFTKLACPYKEFTFGEQIGLWRQVSKLKPDLVHFAMTQQPVLYHGKVITTIHDLTTARYTNPAKNRLVFGIKQVIYRWVIKKVAKKSKMLLTPSKFVKTDVAQYANVNPSKISVIYEAAEKITDSPDPIPKLRTANYLLYVGRPTPHKNLQRAVDAFAIVRQTHPNLKFVLAGKFDGNYQLLKDYAAKNDVKGLVFTDFVSEDQLRWLYENAKVYVFPSLSEGFGLPGLEAMTHGLPVTASNVSCLPEIYGRGALYFDPLEPEDMASKINEVLGNPKLAQELKTRGFKVAASYSWRRMAQETLEVYQTALKQK